MSGQHGRIPRPRNERLDVGKPRPKPRQYADSWARFRVAWRLFCYARPTMNDRADWHNHPDIREDWYRLADQLLKAGDKPTEWLSSDHKGTLYTTDDGLHYLQYHKAGEAGEAGEAGPHGAGWYLYGPYEDGRHLSLDLSLAKLRAADIVANYRALPGCLHCGFLVRWVPLHQRWVHLSPVADYLSCDLPTDHSAMPVDFRPPAEGILAHRSDSGPPRGSR